MKRWLKKRKTALINSPFSPLFYVLYDKMTVCHYMFKRIVWKLKGHGKPTKEQAADVAENVTFIFKSFERKRLAKRLFRSIQRYYPGVRVIIADDSRTPLVIKNPHAHVIPLPFDSGLSYGLNRALSEVTTPYTVRIDDDKFLTPFTCIHSQLAFLKAHPQVDLTAVQICNFLSWQPPRQSAKKFLRFPMNDAPRSLLIPHRTKLDDTHYVFGKTQNTFLVRTESYRRVGYDDRIRMLDHHEFFLRAAGVLVATADIDAFVIHYHNPFNKQYNSHRSDYQADVEYIRQKHNL